ncbi:MULTISPECIES: hypothetical protein [unclassified Corallococcus]|uniref:hypothetical protein n=1 Tax=unclassified Corallococcus TaxID=2685029 RepID=UPI001A8F75BA|nr:MULTISPECIES: hypothetical protein [unclassified Corallococcus]MBN9682489.1 hypothetical protein [Corallococcus sp. NCSPR001]WAS85958.1 hypothetical protein O0N60_03070 [Corallococcus sp. NCRR]
MADHEELMVQKAKRRLAIVVALFGTTFPDVDSVVKLGGKKHLQERNILVAPLSGVQTADHPNGFPEVMRHRIDALMYSQFFYCPSNNSPEVLASVARLDRLFPVVPVAPAAYTPLPLALVDDALNILMALLRMRFGSKQEPEIDELRELLAETVPAQFAPTIPAGAVAGPLPGK